MRQQYKRIGALNKAKGVTVALGLCKLTEEVGELAQAANVTLGIKRGKTELIRDNVLEECADSIQNIMSIANLYGITFAELQQALVTKTDKWENIDHKKPIKSTKKKNVSKN